MTRRWPLPTISDPVRTAVVFLVRGRDHDYAASAHRFLASYRARPAGYPHDLVLLCKGFERPAARDAIGTAFAADATIVLDVDDDSFDLGAYRAAARLLSHARVCFLNGFSEIVSDDWLLKLALNLDAPGIGIVGCTGSFEALSDFPDLTYPNVHLRSNGMMLDRALFLDAIGDRPIVEKRDAHGIENGPDSLTRRIRSRGLEALVVGADGRGYRPPMWSRSRTYRLGRQDNILIADNQTRLVDAYRWDDRAFLAGNTWRRSFADLSVEAVDPPGGEPIRS